jgi:hypothetical protein
MATDYVSEVVRLAGGTMRYEQPSDEDWRAVETKLGLAFPSDYKALVSRLGEGDFGCGLRLRNPCSTSEYTRLSRESLVMHREPILDLEQKLNFPLYPSAGGLVVVASVDRQDFCLRPDITGKRLGELVVWLDIDTEEIRPLNYTVSQFIHDLYLGLIDEPWSEELRVYFWREGEPFFNARRGRNPS